MRKLRIRRDVELNICLFLFRLKSRSRRRLQKQKRSNGAPTAARKPYSIAAGTPPIVITLVRYVCGYYFQNCCSLIAHAYFSNPTGLPTCPPAPRISPTKTMTLAEAIPIPPQELAQGLVVPPLTIPGALILRLPQVVIFSQLAIAEAAGRPRYITSKLRRLPPRLPRRRQGVFRYEMYSIGV